MRRISEGVEGGRFHSRNARDSLPYIRIKPLPFLQLQVCAVRELQRDTHQVPTVVSQGRFVQLEERASGRAGTREQNHGQGRLSRDQQRLQTPAAPCSRSANALCLHLICDISA